MQASPGVVEARGADPLAAAALAYASLGWQVVVLHELRADRTCSCGKDCGNSRGKHPRLPAWQDRATDDLAAVADQWAAFPRSNVGVRAGSGSGIVGVDVDPPRGEEFLAAVSGGDLPPTLEMTTGKGRRLLYAIPDGLEAEPRTVCFQEVDEHGKKVEAVRLQGGTSGAQFVLPPSRHYLGHEYAWVPGRGPNDVLPAPMPGWMVAEMCRPQQAVWDGPEEVRKADPDAPWTVFNRGDKGDSWHAWLTRWGYKPAGGRGDVRYYTRPGKDAGVSVSVGHYRAKDGTPALYTFSGNCPDLPGSKCFDLFGAYARVKFGGDFARAGSELARAGYGSGERRAGADERLRRLEQGYADVRRLVERQQRQIAELTRALAAAGVRDG